MVNVRIVEATDPDNIIDEYDSEVAPRVGEILAWSFDSGARPVHRVVEVRHWRVAMRDEGTKLIGLYVSVEEIPYEQRWQTR